MDKVQQLLLMIARIDIAIPKTFEGAIGMEPAYYEEYIFEYLVSSCSNPIKIF
jgi:predicted metallopeptidase